MMTDISGDHFVDEWKYWIAINGASCAMSALPMRKPKVSPTPQQMLGFPTLEEAKHAQHVCLTAPLDDVKRFLASLSADVKAGRIIAITPANSEPPTYGPTMWLEETRAVQ
jgi:hypothetical protein